MEQILNKLSEIELTAESIMKDADRNKQALSQEMEKKRQDFDAQIARETNDKIHKIRTDMEKEKDERIAAFRRDTEEALAQLDSYYEKNHDRLSRQLFQQILEP